MAIRLGDTAPNFTASSTQGEIRFHEWIGDDCDKVLVSIASRHVSQVSAIRGDDIEVKEGVKTLIFLHFEHSRGERFLAVPVYASSSALELFLEAYQFPGSDI